ncbi:MAG: DinB family protein [Bryobacteraceae bacterium]|nr:DinB family protein [Bryobacteraceae bacterium]
MKATSLLFTSMLIISAVPAFSQASVKDALTRHWKTSGEFTLAVAEKMPDDGYTFRPNPEEMNFGQLMAHIAGVNLNACANASGLTKPELPPKILTWSKDAQKVDVEKGPAIAFLKDSFAFCDKAVAAMTPELLDNVQGPPNRKLTGFEWLWGYFTHTAHHRGQAEVYLRVKGIKPPDYRF